MHPDLARPTELAAGFFDQAIALLLLGRQPLPAVRTDEQPRRAPTGGGGIIGPRLVVVELDGILDAVVAVVLDFLVAFVVRSD